MLVCEIETPGMVPVESLLVQPAAVEVGNGGQAAGPHGAEGEGQLQHGVFIQSVNEIHQKA